MSAAGLDAETKATKTGDCSNDDSVMLIPCFNSSKSALRVWTSYCRVLHRSMENTAVENSIKHTHWITFRGHSCGAMKSSNVMVARASWAAALSCWKGAVCLKFAVSSAAVSGRKCIPVISLYRGSTTGVWHSWEWTVLNGKSVFFNDDTIISSFGSPVSWSIKRIHAKNSENLFKFVKLYPKYCQSLFPDMENLLPIWLLVHTDLFVPSHFWTPDAKFDNCCRCYIATFAKKI